MKKLLFITILFLIIFGLSLNADTKAESIERDPTGLAPRQISNFGNAQLEPSPFISRDPDYQVYAFNAYDPTSAVPIGPVTFILNDPAGLTSLAASSSADFIAAGTMIEDTWIGCEYGSGTFYTMGLDGTMTLIGGNGTACNGLAYDDNSGILYGATYGATSDLYTIDPATGVGTLVGTINSGIIIAMACDNAGNLYGTDIIDDNLYSIDPVTGAGTIIGPLGIGLNYAQGAEYDKDDDVLYLAAYTAAGEVYSCDTSTGATTYIGAFPGGMEVTALAIPYTLAEDDAPAEVSNLVVTADAGGALLCDLDWINPSLTYVGDPLTELLETRVYRDGVLIYTNSGPVIGGADGYTDALPDAGMFSYSVVAYNSAGEGPSASAEVWVGEDIPNAITGLTLTDVTVSVLTAQLDWTNPTTGFHGGYFAGVTGYDIERSDGATFNVTGSATTWQDDSIVDPGVYYYEITPYNGSGDGPTTTSAQVGIGVSIVQVGNGEVGDFQIPINLWYMDSMVEVVYLQEWMGSGMIINTVSFHAATTSTLTDEFNLEIWMGETASDDLSAGWIEGTNLTQVFDGTLNVPAGDSWIDIVLDDDFVYEYNDNLVMLLIRDDDEYYSTSDLWWCTESNTPYRTRFDYTDNSTGSEFDAITGPWDSTQNKTIYPDVRFYYSSLADPEAPGAPTDVTFVADAGGALEVQIDWVCPTLNYGGTALTDLDEMNVYRDGILIYTDSSPTIGGAGSYLDVAVPSSDFYEYSVEGFNSFGEGIPVAGILWVGEDVPNVVENLLLEGQGGGGYVTWDNPTTGLHGGPFNEPILGYTIDRSDGVTFDITGITTEYLDNAIPGADYYSYTVTPYNSIGEGPPATSNLVMLGAGDVIFSDDFEGGLGNWVVEQNGQQGTWMIYTHGSFPNAYTLPPTSTGNICGADADEVYPIDAELTLASPLDLSIYETVNIQFDNDWQAIGASDFAYVDVSLDGGSNWTNVLMFDEIDVRETHEIVDITTVAAGQSDVLIRFYSVQPGWDWWWVIDNVGVYGVEGGGGPTFDPPANVQIDDELGLLTWEEPTDARSAKVSNDASRELLGYDVYLDDDLQGSVTDLEWQYVDLVNGVEYTAGVQAVYDDGTSDIVEVEFTYEGVGAGMDLPLITELRGNYPNPFNPTTKIRFSIVDPGHVQLNIYNMKGQLVKTLVNEELEANFHEVVWNGRDNSGKTTASGVYFYKMRASNYTSTKKMILMK